MLVRIPENIKKFTQKYGHRLSSFSLVGGFIFDLLTLWRIDLFLEDLIFILYLAIGAISISYLTFYEGHESKGVWADRLYLASMIALQFMFGGLFGRFFIFYSRSGSAAVSWPLLIFFAALFVLNERRMNNYKLFLYRIGVFFVALFSFAIFYVPILFSEISVRIFLLGGFASLVLALSLVYALSYFVYTKIKHVRRNSMLLVIGLFALINLMYFTNIIPPIPLSMKDHGVFHSLSRSGSTFTGTHEHQAWYSFLPFRETIHIAPGDSVYVYAAIFAPTNIKTTIIHHWQFYDEKKSMWTERFSVPIEIVGGRDDGYRGYSLTNHPTPGNWRVSIETLRGQIIGRIQFKVEEVETVPPLQTQSL